MNIHGYKLKLRKARDMLKKTKFGNQNIEKGMANIRNKIRKLKQERE